MKRRAQALLFAAFLLFAQGANAAVYSMWVLVTTICDEVVFIDGKGKFQTFIQADDVTFDSWVWAKGVTLDSVVDRVRLVELLISLDTRDLKAVVVGYGANFREMVNNARYRQIFTFPEGKLNTCSLLQRNISKTADNKISAQVNFPLPPLATSFAAAYNVYAVAVQGAITLDTDKFVAVQRIDAMYQFTATNQYEPYLSGPIKAYLSNASTSNTVAVTILANAAAPELSGSMLFVGYGLSSDEMLKSGTYSYWGLLP